MRGALWMCDHGRDLGFHEFGRRITVFKSGNVIQHRDQFGLELHQQHVFRDELNIKHEFELKQVNEED